MNYTIYLTDGCNLNCKYCYEKNMHKNNEIPFEYIKGIVDDEINSKSQFSILTFYGGEPLLKKKLIYETDKYINAQKHSTKFLYNMTTNGTLIDDEFVSFFDDNKFISLSLSIDGTEKSHNENRKTLGTKDTFEVVKENAKKLISKSDIVVAVPVVSKSNACRIYENLIELLDIGFKRINFQFDFTANWEDEDLEIIKREFSKVAEKYIEAMREEKEFHLLQIDEKIRSYIDDSMDCNDDCSVGVRGANLGTDGNIYPCMQFMYDERYKIGDYKTGIDKKRQIKVHNELKREMDECKECDLKKRCNHTCSCLNKAYTGSPTTTSPFTCEIERMMISVADGIGEKLYKEKNPIFIQKFYNMNYNSIERDILKKGGNPYGTKESK